MGLFGGGSLGSILGSVAPAAGAGIGGLIGGPVGGVIGGSIGQGIQQQQINEQNMANAKQAFNWQKQETDTAYRRAYADMKAAGINPILAAGGGGAQSASQSISPAQSIAKTNVGSSAIQAMQGEKAIEQSDATVKKLGADTQLAGVQQKLAASQAEQSSANAKQILLRNEMMKNELPNQKSRIEFEQKQRKIDSDMQQYDNTIRRIDQTGSAIGSAISGFIPKLRINTNANPQQQRKAQRYDEWQDSLRNNPSYHGELP